MCAIALLQLPIPDPDPAMAGANVPLAAGYLKACLPPARRAAVSILPRELARHGGDAAILDWLADQEPGLAGFSCYLWNLERSLWLAARLKERVSSARVLFGGPEIVEGRLPAGARGRGRLRAGRGGAGVRGAAGSAAATGAGPAAAVHARPAGPPGGRAQSLHRRDAGGAPRRAAVPGDPARLPAPLQLLLLRQAVPHGAPLPRGDPAGGLRPGARARGAGDLPDGPLLHFRPAGWRSAWPAWPP